MAVNMGMGERSLQYRVAKSGGVELAQTMKLLEMSAKAANAGYGGTAEMAEKFIQTVSKGEDED